MRLIDWVLRTALLVLSCLATLAMVGALASVSDSRLGDAFPGRTAASGRSEAQPADNITPETNELTANATQPAPTTKTVAPPPNQVEATRWLKALTYAVLALAAFAAAGVVALLRIAAHLDRIAEQ